MSRTPVAVISMGGFFPDALTLEQYWKNLISKKTSFIPIPKDIWDTDLFYSEERSNPYKTRGILGAPIRGFKFPYEKYKAPPKILEKLDISIQLALEATRVAIENLKHPLTEKDRENICVAMGCIGPASAQTNSIYLLRHRYAYYLENQLKQNHLPDPQIETILKQFHHYFETEYNGWDNVSAALSNVSGNGASLINTLFNLRGFSMTVDAACASSFAALEMVCNALAIGDIDMGIAGGLDANIMPTLFIGFDNIDGLSARHCHPFDNSADGILMGQGAGVVILKRLEDALSHKDTILGVIRGIGSASDGSRKAIYAPDVEGIQRAIHSAWEDAQWTPDMVDYIEAHATGTRVGDATEYDVFGKTYASYNQRKKDIRIGAVKGNIGHLKGAAGIAGLIKTLLAFQHKTYPPLAYFDTLTKMATYDGPGLTLSTEPDTWVPNEKGMRRAALSANGFGGIDFHILLEHGPLYEYSAWEQPKKQEYAIVAQSCLLPHADNPDEYWNNITNKKSIFTKASELKEFFWEIHGCVKEALEPEKTCSNALGYIKHYTFNAIQFKIVPLREPQLDQSQRYGLELSQRLKLKEMFKEHPEWKQRTAVIIGGSTNQKSLESVMPFFGPLYEKVLHSIPDFKKLSEPQQQTIPTSVYKEMTGWYPPPTEESMPGWMNNVLSGRISKVFDVLGPNFVIDAGCSSFMGALLASTYQLQSKRVDQVMVGGINANISSLMSITMNGIRALAPDVPKPYDTNDKGTVLSEGGVMFMLKRLEDAVEQKDTILAVVSGISGSSEGSGHSLLPNSSASIKLAVERCLKKTGGNAALDFIEGNGIGVQKSLAEIEAFAETLQPTTPSAPIPLTCAKGHLGYLFGGSAAVSLLNALLALQHKIIPGIQYLETHHPLLQSYLDKILPIKETIYLQDRNQPMRVGILSASYSGSNYFVIIREPDS